MIYLRLHQARNEEIDPGARKEEAGGSRGKQGNFTIVAKFCYNSKIFATISISLHREFSLLQRNFAT